MRAEGAIRPLELFEVLTGLDFVGVNARECHDRPLSLRGTLHRAAQYVKYIIAAWQQEQSENKPRPDRRNCMLSGDERGSVSAPAPSAPDGRIHIPSQCTATVITPHRMAQTGKYILLIALSL